MAPPRNAGDTFYGEQGTLTNLPDRYCKHKKAPADQPGLGEIVFCVAH
jgi:hypothetical protein